MDIVINSTTNADI